MEENLFVLYYVCIFIFIELLVMYSIHSFSKKNDFDFGDNELVLGPKIMPHFYVVLTTLFIAGLVLRELVGNLLVELVVATLISSVMTLINMRLIYVTLYFRDDRLIIYKHANKSTEVLLIKNIKEVKRNKHLKRYAELSVFYYNDHKDRISTEKLQRCFN